MVDLKCPPMAIFDEDLTSADPLAHSNYFRFRLGPEMVIATGARVKQPGESMRGDDVELDRRHRPSRGAPPYERLLRRRAARRLRRCSPATKRSKRRGAWSIRCSMRRAGRDRTSPAAGGRQPRRTSSSDGEGWHDPRPEAKTPC